MWFLRFLRGICLLVSWVCFFPGLFFLVSAGWEHINYQQKMAEWVDAGQVYQAPADPGELVAVLMVWSVVLLAVATGLLLLRWGLGKMEGVFYAGRNFGFFRRVAGGGMFAFRGRRGSTTAHSPAR